jgi:pimeloyl-ACP methyl ester carboxylesterase
MTVEIQSNLARYRQNGGKAAVVFIHGFGGNVLGTWEKFPSFLAADKRLDEWDIFSLGYATSLSLDVSGIWTADPPLISVADLLRTRAVVSPLKDYGCFALVAHSMGGLVAQRAILDDAEFAGRVSHLILFGTPSNGLVKAWWLRFWKRSINNMAQGGTFIADLRQRWNKQFAEHIPFKFLAIAGDEDEFVPRTSSIDPFPQQFRYVVEGNHLEIVKPASDKTVSVQLVLNGLTQGTVAGGPMNAAAVAVESRDFQKAIDTFWPKRQELDSAATVRLALALDGVGRSDDALKVLEDQVLVDGRHRRNTDAIGVLAGRLKRRWIAEHAEADAQRAQELYAKGLQLSEPDDHAQAFYHGVNIAFMNRVYGESPQQAKEMAAKALQHCAQAKRDIWRVATEAECYLYLGNFEDALKRYSEAVAMNPKPWQVRSMHKQAAIVARHCGDTELEARLAAVLRGGEA